MTEEVMQYLLLNLKGCCEENLLFALTKDIAKRNGQKKWRMGDFVRWQLKTYKWIKQLKEKSYVFDFGDFKNKHLDSHLLENVNRCDHVLEQEIGWAFPYGYFNYTYGFNIWKQRIQHVNTKSGYIEFLR